ncbi:MAG: ROK family protein [Eubacterium sp.]|nr:ROK family protein [Eubacterium sp.]
MKKYVSIDIGGTAIKYGLINGDGEILTHSEMPTEAQKGGPSILVKAIKIVEQFCQEHTVSGICISTAGVVDTKKGAILYAAPLIPRYTGICLKEPLEKQFHVPCEVENDVNCAGLAESLSGAGRGFDPMLMLTVGTGIGGSLVTGGQIYHGASYSACEVGYLKMRGSDFQTLGSASSLCQRVAEKKQEPLELWDGLRIFRQAMLADPACIQAIDEMTEVIGLGIANLCYILNPEIIVLGGGIMAQEDYLSARIQKAAESFLVGNLASSLRIAFAKHKNLAGMLGAFYHFKACHPD